ncbi:MAG: FliA/WhiG family RNA polymerase sigma factor [Actinomycetota bacterium]
MGQNSEADVTRLVEKHLDLVKHVVFQVSVHFPRHVDRSELADAGALGLVEAAQRFEADRGVPFERFAARRIRGSILDAVRAGDWAPRSVRTVARQLEQTEQELANNLGRRPNDTEIAEQLGVDDERLAELRHRVYRSVVLALDHYVAPEDDEELTLVDVLTDPDDMEPAEELAHRELHGYLRDALDLLPERHRLVVVGYFLEGRTSLELASFLGVTESRISQLRSESLQMLKEGIEAQYDGERRDPSAVKGRVNRRKAAYADAIADRSGWQQRIEERTSIDLRPDYVSVLDSGGASAS